MPNDSASPLPVIALVGRPNVGKSTLFNRLTASRDALVADQPGVTRDRRYGYGSREGRRFIVVDTGGIGQDDEDIDSRARAQTETALEEADAVLLLVDYRQGLMSGDEAIAAALRRSGRSVFVAVNKSEGQTGATANAEFHALGFGEPWAISADHGDRVALMLDFVLAHLPEPRAAVRPQNPSALRLAVLGRPNAGKSTLVNRLVRAPRMLTQDAPGTTRDAVSSEFTFDDKPYAIVDTAGIRRHARISDHLEKISVIKAMQAAEQAHVVILMIDGRAGLSAQDVRLLNLIVEAGRSAVIAVNKWDGLSEDERSALHDEIVRRMSVFDYLPLLFISALHGSGLRELLEAVRSSHAASQAELSTSQLSRALEDMVAAHAPPAVHGRRIKLRFAHQGGHNPPTIVIHGNQTQRLPAEYRRYMMHRFRQRFDLYGTPVRLIFKNSDNPYAGKARRRR